MTMIAAGALDGVDPFVVAVALFLVAALVARSVLMGMDRDALQKSVEAWVPRRRCVLEDWVPAPPRPKTLVGDARRRP